jgi:hypothetical protein
MEVSQAFAAGDGLAAETAATAATGASGELQMPTPAGEASLKTRLACLAHLFAAALMASVFIGVPLAAALHVVLYQPLLDIICAAAITAELALMVAYVVLKTATSVRESPA